MPPAPTLSARPTYRRHRPEQTVLYSVIAEHYPWFVQEIERSGGHLPSFVRQEFEDYLKCGLLEHGFLRVKCDGCRHEHPGSSPGQALTRFHGIFAPNAKHRHKIVPPRARGRVDSDTPLAPMTPDRVRGRAWAQRLKRVAPDGDGYGLRKAQEVP